VSESSLQTDPACGDKRVVRPQPHPRVSRLECEGHAGVDQTTAQAAPAPGGEHQQDPPPRWLFVLRYAEDAADTFAVELGDPARLPAGSCPTAWSATIRATSASNVVSQPNSLSYN
jgi:hypothetical protein